MFHRLLNKIDDHIAANNAEPIDVKLTDGSYIALLHFARVTAAGWHNPANAVHTVADGKKAVILSCLPTTTIQADPSYRRARLEDTGAGATVITDDHFRHGGIPGFTTDAAGGLPVPEAVAGAVLSLQLWNADNNARTMGAAVIFAEIDA